MNINKQAASDAADWARAEMFFGEGAGTRRKLLWAAISEKISKIDGYSEAFSEAYENQNFAEHAAKAIRERHNIDRANMVGKNAKALLRGDRRGLSTGVLVVVTVAIVAHQTGYDEVVYKEAKKYYRKLKTEFMARKFQHDMSNVSYMKGHNA